MPRRGWPRALLLAADQMVMHGDWREAKRYLGQERFANRRLQAGGIRRRYLLTLQRWRALRDLLVAVDRMRDGWAEGDALVKEQLWTDLHNRAEALREMLQ